MGDETRDYFCEVSPVYQTLREKSSQKFWENFLRYAYDATDTLPGLCIATEMSSFEHICY